MKKIWISAQLLVAVVLSAAAQNQAPDSTTFIDRKLKLQEVNFVSGYYAQDGNNSAVTGGIGTEKLTDVSVQLDVKLGFTDPGNRQHAFKLGAGIEHYTSASSDNINPNTISSASAADTRIYPTASWAMLNAARQYSVGAGISYSTEYDYESKGASLSFGKFSKDRNREFNLFLSAYLDTWTIIYPVELRRIQTPEGEVRNPNARGNAPRNTYNAALTFAQVINNRMQFSVMLDLAQQTGQLGTLFHRVYFSDNSLAVEHLPEQRYKIPVGVRFNYFATDRILLRSFYRFYTDSWGIAANTIELETPYKLTPFVSLSPFYRFYVQSASKHFAPHKEHNPAAKFYTSDYDLSAFTSHMLGANVRLNSATGIFKIPHFSTLELRYGYYLRSNGLHANMITVAGTFR